MKRECHTLRVGAHDELRSQIEDREADWSARKIEVEQFDSPRGSNPGLAVDLWGPVALARLTVWSDGHADEQCLALDESSDYHRHHDPPLTSAQIAEALDRLTDKVLAPGESTE